MTDELISSICVFAAICGVVHPWRTSVQSSMCRSTRLTVRELDRPSCALSTYSKFRNRISTDVFVSCNAIPTSSLILKLVLVLSIYQSPPIC